MVSGAAVAQTPVPATPAPTDKPQTLRDKRYGVRFEVPAGWGLAKKDRQVSTFRLDARSASPKSDMRAVAAMNFNPFPLSNMSGALFYYSVQRRTNDHECALQAYSFGQAARPTEEIGGMDFQHGHDEHGKVCTEARDEVYTAYRKGSCYRFDLTVNTFCSVSSGALEMTKSQMRDVQAQMEGMLSSVVLDWKPSASDKKTSPTRRPLAEPAPTAGSPRATGQAF